MLRKREVLVHQLSVPLALTIGIEIQKLIFFHPLKIGGAYPDFLNLSH